jgi:predicted SnoaL-like aldol condensation-catalyzing enzyme
VNKRLVQAFYQAVFGDKDLGAIDTYIDEETYIQHSPLLADGREAFKAAATVWLEGQPPETIDFAHVGADGDLVYLHLKGRFEGKLMAMVHIYRVSGVLSSFPCRVGIVLAGDVKLKIETF